MMSVSFFTWVRDNGHQRAAPHEWAILRFRPNAWIAVIDSLVTFADENGSQPWWGSVRQVHQGLLPQPLAHGGEQERANLGWFDWSM